MTMARTRLRAPADDPTSTAQWSLVIHRVSQHAVDVWVGTLFPFLTRPERARVRLITKNGKVRTRIIRTWQRPFPGLRQRFFTVVTFRGLDPGRDHPDVSGSRFPLIRK